MTTTNRRIGGIFGLLAGAALALASGAPACTSEFSSCDPDCESDDAGSGSGSGSGGSGAAGSGTGSGSGSGGSSAAGGENAGGAGGERDEGPLPLPETCEVDIDCNDGSACTGTEVCVDGKCEYGESPCAALVPPDHCGVVCTEGASGPNCEIGGLDADGDGHDDALCVSHPGDDCNDNPGEGETIHPGAPELCNDNVDDDCDELDETKDEVLLAGEAKVLVGPVGTTKRDEAELALNPNGGLGLVWSDFRHQGAGPEGPITSEIYFRAIDADGSAGNELRITTSTTHNEHRSPSLAWGVDRFGVAWTQVEVNGGASTINFVRVAADGSTFTTHGPLDGIGTDPVPTGPPRVAWYSQGAALEWAVYFASQSNGLVRWHVSSAGTVAPLSSGGFGNPGVDYDASGFPDGRTYYVLASGNTASGSIHSSGGDASFLNGLSGIANVVAGGEYFAYQTKSDEDARVDSAMRNSCLGRVPDAIPAAVGTANEVTYLLFWDTALTSLLISAMDTPASGYPANCALGPSALVAKSDETTTISNADMAVDPDGNITVVWTSKNEENGEWSIMSRSFTGALCE